MHGTQLNQSYAIKITKPKIQMNPIEKKHILITYIQTVIILDYYIYSWFPKEHRLCLG